MVLQAYIDDSTEAGEVMVLAGYIASPEQWAQFSIEWAELLTLAPRWKRFKMSEAADRGGDLSRERIEFHYRIIEKYVQAAFCIAVPKRPLAKIVTSLNLPAQLGNPYYLAWRGIISILLEYHSSFEFDDPMEFIFDSQSEMGNIKEAWEIFSTNIPLNRRSLMNNVPVFRNDETLLPLQAADLLAWWMRKRYVEQGSVRNDAFPFPWPPKRAEPLMCLYAEFGEDAIYTQLMRDKQAASRSGPA